MCANHSHAPSSWFFLVESRCRAPIGARHTGHGGRASPSRTRRLSASHTEIQGQKQEGRPLVVGRRRATEDLALPSPALVICGLQTELCIDTAADLGFSSLANVPGWHCQIVVSCC